MPEPRPRSAKTPDHHRRARRARWAPRPWNPARAAFMAVLALAPLACGPAVDVDTPPVAEARPYELTIHGDTRIDPYFWLRERENPDVIAYLEAENEYSAAMMAHTEALQEELFQEMKAREPQDDASAPQRIGDWYYYTRYEEGKDYRIHARRRGSMDAPEEVLLDENELAEGHGFFSASTQVSPDHRILAFGADTVGRRFYTVRFKDLETGEVLEDVIPDVTSNMAWATDSRTILYTRQDPQTLRWDRVFRHHLGESDDALVYAEPDEEFSVDVTRTRSDAYLVIASVQTQSTESRIIDADRPDEAPRVFLPRRDGHEYAIEHHGSRFFVRTNSGGATNFRLMQTPVDRTDEAAWTEVIPHREDVFLEGVDAFRDHIVLAERSDGLERLRVIALDGAALGEDHHIDFGEPAYMAFTAGNPEFDTDVVRYVYSSMTTPTSQIDYDMNTRASTVVKQAEVLGGFDRVDYRTERLWAPARDGLQVPVSVVYRVDTPLNGTAPLLVYGYGSYGSSESAAFSASRLSLLDRGFVYAIAHIRGGQELGRGWYEDGKLLNKKNTFTDFIDAAEYLVAEGYGARDRVFAEGGSAGGLLMGAVVNMRPDLWRGVIAGVPFVDVVTTMLDASIPLTTSEYDEWGNPNDPEYYGYMLSYSPYDNVEAKAYPALLVTTGLHDSQVQYWEPAKWVAKLRAAKTDDNVLILQTNMEAGHGGASGRDLRYRERAFEYAFLIDLAR